MKPEKTQFQTTIALLRSCIFWLVFASSTILWGGTLWIFALFPHRIRFAIIVTWSKLNTLALDKICGVNYQVEGRENLPDGPAIVLSNHQSTWETLSLAFLVPPQVWVLKKELLKIPFFGWGLAMSSPIAIDRNAGINAREQVVEQGHKRLDSGLWVIIFPEGTRVDPGVHRRFKPGGAILASRSGYPVVPIAHNAGLFWPRHQFIKYPGTITVRIGPTIPSKNRQPDQINAEAETWIRKQLTEIS